MSGDASESNLNQANPGEFYTQLARSGVLSARLLDDLRGRIETGNWPSKNRELASRLVYENWLTEFQAKRILSGRGNELVVGRYTILDRLGSGSMGRVYRAQHQLMGRTVALKVIAPELITNDRVISRFLREMRLVARLDHPNVVRAFDADRVDDQFFIVMEYVQGKSLGDLLKQGPLSPVEVIRYGSQAALGLSHAHDQGILHRDVKPSNLLLASDQKIVKVLDLGLGTLMEVDPEESFRTADGIAVGTIDYMSPEQASGKNLDGRSDLYSLASCMYHLMTGRCPFQHENAIKRLALRINTQPTPLREYIPNLPGKVVAVMEKMLATDPADRFQTGVEASEALLGLLKKKRQFQMSSPMATAGDASGSHEVEAVSRENETQIATESSVEVIAGVQESSRRVELQINQEKQNDRITIDEPSKATKPRNVWIWFLFVVGISLGFAVGVFVGRMF